MQISITWEDTKDKIQGQLVKWYLSWPVITLPIKSRHLIYDIGYWLENCERDAYVTQVFKNISTKQRLLANYYYNGLGERSLHKLPVVSIIIGTLADITWEILVDGSWDL